MIMMEVAFQQSLFLETMVYEYSNFICRVLLQSVGNVINNGRGTNNLFLIGRTPVNVHLTGKLLVSFEISSSGIPL